MADVIFNVFVLLTIIPSLWVAFSSKIVHASYSLLFTLFGVAGLYVLMGADYIGVVQVVVYIGGIMVLVIFALMMTQGAKMLPLSVQLPGRLLAGVLCGLLLLALATAAMVTRWPQAASTGAPRPTTENIGDLLLGKYLIVFELASLMLLAALVGAVLIVRHAVEEE